MDSYLLKDLHFVVDLNLTKVFDFVEIVIMVLFVVAKEIKEIVELLMVVY